MASRILVSSILFVILSGCGPAHPGSAGTFVLPPKGPQKKTDQEVQKQFVGRDWCSLRPSGEVEHLSLLANGNFSFATRSAADAKGARTTVDLFSGTWTFTNGVVKLISTRQSVSYPLAVRTDGSTLSFGSENMTPCTAGE